MTDRSSAEQKRRQKFFAVITLLLCMTMGGHPAACAGEIGASEYKIKAAYLYNFLLFVSWPETGRPADAMRIGIVGDNPFGTLFSHVEGRQVKPGMALAVDFLGPYEAGMDLRKYDLLFVSDSAQRDLERILEHLGEAPVLTVGEGRGLAEQGLMISLVKADRKIRWEINRRPVKSAGLRLSSQILRNAVRVTE